MSLTSYRAAPPRVKEPSAFDAARTDKCEANAETCRAEERRSPKIGNDHGARKQSDKRELILHLADLAATYSPVP